MKKTHILTAILILIYGNTFCQLEKKTWLVGGAGSFSNSKQELNNSVEKNKSTILTLSPRIGFFLIDKLAVGIEPSISFNQIKSINTKSTVTSYKIDPFIRYYFFGAEKMVNLFLQSQIGFGLNKFKNFGNNISTSKFISYSVLAGPVLYFNSSVGLELNLGWAYQKNIDDKSNIKAFIGAIGFQIHLKK